MPTGDPAGSSFTSNGTQITPSQGGSRNIDTSAAHNSNNSLWPSGGIIIGGELGGGTPGVTGTQPGKNGMPSVPQVDAPGIQQYFQEAQQQMDSDYATGLTQYQTAINTAITAQEETVTNANDILQPISTAGTEALNQQMMMLGLTPQSPTATYGPNLNNDNLTNIPEANSMALLANQMEGTTDPTQRAALLQAIQGQSNMANNDSLAPAPVAPQTITAQNVFSTDPTLANSIEQSITDANAGHTGIVGNAADVTSILTQPSGDAQQDQMNQLNATNAANYQSQLASYQSTANATSTQLGQLNSWTQGYNNAWMAQPNLPYTGAQISAQLESTPGYQFTLAQGEQAAARTGAANGLVNAPNTQIAEQAYGQGLASSTYNSYMQQLSNIATLGSSATGQIAANTYNAGIGISNILQTAGANEMSEGENLGNADYSAMAQQGTVYNQDAMYNATNQEQVLLTLLNSEASANNSATAAAPGLAQAANVATVNSQNAQSSADFAAGATEG